MERSEGIGGGNLRLSSSPRHSNGLSAQSCFSSTVRACFLRGGQCTYVPERKYFVQPRQRRQYLITNPALRHPRGLVTS